MRPTSYRDLTCADARLNDVGTPATLDRTLAHLSDNGVDMKSTKLGLGPNLKFDPQAQTFPGNEAANKLLTREYRAAFVVPTKENV